MTRKFPLAVLLALREQREQAEERMLTQTNAQLAELRQVLRRLADQLAQLAETRLGQVQTLRLGTEILSFEARWKELRNGQAEMQSKFQALEAQRSVQLGNYLRARSDRETLTEVRDQHRKEWESYEKLREQKAIGDLFNARRKRK